MNGLLLRSQVRQVSNNILKTTDAGVVSDREFTHMVTSFGQWNDHDITFTPFSPSIRSFSNGLNCDESCEQSEPCIPIPVGFKPETFQMLFSLKDLLHDLDLPLQSNRFLLVTLGIPPKRNASLRSGPPLRAEQDTRPTISAESPTRGSRSTRWRPSWTSARCTALRTSSPFIFVTLLTMAAYCAWTRCRTTDVSCCPSIPWRRRCVPRAKESPTTQTPRRCPVSLQVSQAANFVSK